MRTGTLPRRHDEADGIALNRERCQGCGHRLICHGQRDESRWLWPGIIPERRCHAPVNPNASGVHVMPHITVNQVNFAGTLARDPERCCLASGIPVARLGMAGNHRMKQGDAWQDDPCSIDVTVFGKAAEWAGEYLDKGHAGFDSDRLPFTSREDQRGQQRSTHEVLADPIMALNGTGRSSGREPGSDDDQGDRDRPFSVQVDWASGKPYGHDPGHRACRLRRVQVDVLRPNRRHPSAPTRQRRPGMRRSCPASAHAVARVG